MARYDKYDPKAGGFRALLAADWVSGNLDKPLGVSLNATGRVKIGAAGGATDSGFVGVIVLTKIRKAGAVVDIMTDGEMVEFVGDPGTKYYAQADGSITDTPSAYYVGVTAESDRLVVRCQEVAEVAP